MRLCRLPLLLLLLVVLGCTSSHAAPSPSYVVADDCSRSVLIRCPNVTGDDLRFNLFKDQQVVCNATCKLEQDGRRCEPHCSRPDVKPHQSEDGRLSGFVVTASNSSAAFHCDATVTFPPPLKNIQTDAVVLVLGHQCGRRPSQSAGDEDDTGRSQGWPWIWIVVVSLLGIYSVAASVLAWVGWAKLSRTELQNDYMNTKPRIQRVPKKKKGIQNPLPRHF